MTTNTRFDAAKARFQGFRDGMDDSPGSFLLALVILTILLALALKVITINVQPFLILFGSEAPPTSNIPIVGWAWDVLNLIYVATGAFIAWFLVQLAQVMWILIVFDRRAHRGALRESMREEAYQDTESRSTREARHIKRMKRRAIRMPFFFMAASGWIALSGFVTESIVAFHAYPVIKNWDEFFAGLVIGDLSPVNWGHVGMQFFCLFSTELLVIAIITVWQWVWSHKNAENPSP
jgi:hypothetical protein